MMFCSVVTGQDQPLKILDTILRKGSIPHALLFTGIDGIGKRMTALDFARACNCTASEPESIPCGQCRSCRKIESGSHPDIHLVEPSGTFIKIDQIRELCQKLSLKPYEATLRIAVLSDADAMNPEAGNALLKVLEEPPDRTILILTAKEDSDLLPTIVSRCHPIRFRPISSDIIRQYLIGHNGLTPDQAAVIAALADGSFSKAISMAESANRLDWIERRDWLIDTIDPVLNKNGRERQICSLLALSEKLAQHKDILQDNLELIKSWIRDLIIFKYAPNKTINPDLKPKLKGMSQKMPDHILLEKMDALHKAQRHIQSNANVRLVLDRLMIAHR